MSVEITNCPKCKSEDIQLIKIIEKRTHVLSDLIKFKCIRCDNIFESLQYNPDYNHSNYLI